MIHFITFLASIVLILSQCSQIYGVEMDDISKLFEPSFKPSKYKLLSVEHNLQEPNKDPFIRLMTFQYNYEMFLDPDSNVLIDKDTPIWLGYKSGDITEKATYARFKHNLHYTIYQNVETNTTLMITKSGQGKIKVYGKIGYNWISPISEQVHNEIRRKRSVSSDNLEMDNFADHMMFDCNDCERSSPVIANKFKRSLEESTVPEYYPEMLIAIDYYTYKYYDKPLVDFVKMIVLLFANVDLRYRSIEDFKLRLNIAGIVIAMEEGVATYVEDNLQHGNPLKMSETIVKLKSYFNGNNYIPEKDYDLILALTRHQTDDLGLAYIGGLCEGSSRGVVRMSPTSTATIAHELAHIFGADHDEDVDWCQSYKGFIMSGNDVFTQYAFSPCSIGAMQQSLRTKTCVQNKPNVRQIYNTLLPGLKISLDEQCHMALKGSNASSCVNDNPCTNVWCSLGNGNCGQMSEAFDGTPCPLENKEVGLCLLNKCISIQDVMSRY